MSVEKLCGKIPEGIAEEDGEVKMRIRFKKRDSNIEGCLGDDKDHKSRDVVAPFEFFATHVYDLTNSYENENSISLDCWISHGFRWDFYNPNAHLRVILPKQLPLGREIRAICPLVKRREANKGFRLNLTDEKFEIEESSSSLSMIFICFDPNNISSNILTWQDRLALSQLKSSIQILSAAKSFAAEDLDKEREFESRITVRRSFSLTSIHLKYIFILYLYLRICTLNIKIVCTHTHSLT